MKRFLLFSALIGAMICIAMPVRAQGPLTTFYSDSVLLGFNATTATDSLDSTRGWVDTVRITIDLRSAVSDSLLLSIKPDTIRKWRKLIGEYQHVLFGASNAAWGTVVADTFTAWQRITWQKFGTATLTDTIRGNDTLFTDIIERGNGDGMYLRFRSTLNDTTTLDSILQTADIDVEIRGIRAR